MLSGGRSTVLYVRRKEDVMQDDLILRFVLIIIIIILPNAFCDIDWQATHTKDWIELGQVYCKSKKKKQKLGETLTPTSYEERTQDDEDQLGFFPPPSFFVNACMSHIKAN